MNTKLIFAVLSFLVAFVFTFLLPQSGAEQVVVGLLTIAGTYLGINWRQQYDEVKEWMKSKTITGAIIFGVALLAYIILPMFVSLSNEIKTLLEIIVYGGGLGFIIGVIDAIRKSNKNNLN